MARDRALINHVEELLDQEWPLPIVQAGDPVLRQLAAPVRDQLSPRLLDKLIAAMVITMHDAPGVGLAGPQIGLSLALAVVEDEGDPEDQGPGTAERTPLEPRTLFNPVYEPIGEERATFFEGCLSVSGWFAQTARWRSVRLTTTAPDGATHVEELSGWPARIIQHETDHLGGRLYSDIAEMTSLTTGENLARFELE